MLQAWLKISPYLVNTATFSRPGVGDRINVGVLDLVYDFLVLLFQSCYNSKQLILNFTKL